MADQEANKLFVGGLSWDTTEEKLQDYFSDFGEVEHVMIMLNRETGKSRGFGFVTFTSPKSVKLALAVPTHIIDNRTIDPKICTTKHSRPRREPDSCKQEDFGKIFLGGLPPNITESALRDFFSQFGRVMEVIIMYDQEKNRARGFGFLTFDSDEPVNQLVNDRYVEIDGKQVEVKRASPQGKTQQSGGYRGGYNGGNPRHNDGYNNQSQHSQERNDNEQPNGSAQQNQAPPGPPNQMGMPYGYPYAWPMWAPQMMPPNGWPAPPPGAPNQWPGYGYPGWGGPMPLGNPPNPSGSDQQPQGVPPVGYGPPPGYYGVPPVPVPAQAPPANGAPVPPMATPAQPNKPSDTVDQNAQQHNSNSAPNYSTYGYSNADSNGHNNGRHNNNYAGNGYNQQTPHQPNGPRHISTNHGDSQAQFGSRGSSGYHPYRRQ